jgi:hypothetical protein
MQSGESLDESHPETLILSPDDAAASAELLRPDHQIERLRNTNISLYRNCRAGMRYVANKTIDAAGAVETDRSRFHDSMSWTISFLFHDVHLGQDDR